MKKILFVILAIILILASASLAVAQKEPQSYPEATQEEPSIGLKIVDVLLVRPIGVVGSTVSTATYIAISPLAFVMGLGEPAVRVMVEAPWRFTSCRYIGEFNHYKDERSIMGVWDFF